MGRHGIVLRILPQYRNKIRVTIELALLYNMHVSVKRLILVILKLYT